MCASIFSMPTPRRAPRRWSICWARCCCCCRSSLVIAWFALPYVARSWALLERSRETSGLPFVYLLKTLIPLFALLLALQGVSQAIRAARVLARTGPLSPAMTA